MVDPPTVLTNPEPAQRTAGYCVGTEREQTAREIGCWLRRALDGRPRGPSGRDRIQLASRFYLVCRDIHGNLRNPPLLFSSWKLAKEVCCRQGEPGDAVFIGLPSKEIEIALQGAAMTTLSDTPSRLEEKPEASGLRDNFVLSGDTVVEDYKIGILSLTEPAVSTSCISICAYDNRVLVAVHARWRLGPAQERSSLAKRCLEEVCASIEDRGAPSGEASLHVWLGLLSTALEAQVFFDEDAEPPGIDFPVGDDGVLEIPLAQALVAVSRDHFTFMTAESEAPVKVPDVKLEGRMDKLEEGLSQLITMVWSDAKVRASMLLLLFQKGQH